MFARRVVMAAACIALVAGCDEQPIDETQEIMSNLVQAGFPADDIMVVDGKVYVGRDAEVPLRASREMLKSGDATKEQYRTTNLVSPALAKICIDGSTFTGAFSTALDMAIQNYNERSLTFTMARTPSAGCDFTINAVIQPGVVGGSAGFPSGGLPYHTINIGGGLSSYSVEVIEHVITHELGHTIGFRHSDYYNRNISCGSDGGGNEGPSDVGAILVPGTPTTATVGGSLMNSCIRSVDTGEFTSSDITALMALYGRGKSYPTPSVAQGRFLHTATTLPSGKVLIAGGDSNGTITSSATLYDPVTHSWSGAGDMTTPRRYHTATLLPSGKVLVVGGQSPSGGLATAELYDPQTGMWTPTASIEASRYRHAATLLPSGKVLVTGGLSIGPQTHTQIYDPATDSWTWAGTLMAYHWDHTATLLPSGKVLVAGGYSNRGVVAATEVYDPATGSSSATGSLNIGRDGHTATLLLSGKVLVAGGAAGLSQPISTEVYDPATGTWSYTGSFSTGHRYHTATLLPSGKVLVAGGDNGSTGGLGLVTVEVYDPATGSWSAAASLTTPRRYHVAAPLAAGKVLVMGGHASGIGSRDTAEVYVP